MQPSFENAGNAATPGGYQVVKETLVVQPTSGGAMAPVTPVKEVHEVEFTLSNKLYIQRIKSDVVVLAYIQLCFVRNLSRVSACQCIREITQNTIRSLVANVGAVVYMREYRPLHCIVADQLPHSRIIAESL